MEKAHALMPPAGRPNTAIEAVDFIIASALKMKASDIHLAPNFPTKDFPDKYILRFRVFGKLQIIRAQFLNTIYSEVMARVKVLAEMSQQELGMPQDGQLTVTSPNGAQTVLRISTIPSQGTEELVIRVQRGGSTSLSIDQLQMTDSMRKQLKRVAQQKSGLIVLNGPAGSGKTTTIYSILNSLASPEKKIITAEDPVETRLPFVNHTQVSLKTSFASLARAFMRQDADVIFIGEIRDEESAQIALQLAQTGHLVLTSLHSRDAVGVISRLETLGVHPNNIATTLICSLGQRLIPALCSKCKQPTTLDDATLTAMNGILEIPADVKFFKVGPGCESCLKGYSGRLPLFELLVVDSEISDSINAKRSRSHVLDLARSKGMATLAEEALLRLYFGYTDIESVQSYIAAAAAANGTSASTAQNDDE